MTHWIESGDWQTVVKHMPIPSVDLVVTHGGGVVLCRRTNEPAKDTWFLPGGRMRKGERLRETVHRVAGDEIGVNVTINDRIGVHNHFYELHDVEGVATKQYLSHGFLVEAAGGSSPAACDDQHDDVRVFYERPDDCLEYVGAYLSDAGVL